MASAVISHTLFWPPERLFGLASAFICESNQQFHPNFWLHEVISLQRSTGANIMFFKDTHAWGVEVLENHSISRTESTLVFGSVESVHFWPLSLLHEGETTKEGPITWTGWSDVQKPRPLRVFVAEIPFRTSFSVVFMESWTSIFNLAISWPSF